MLDFVTALVSWAAVSLAVAPILLVLWRRDRVPAYLWWAAGFLLCAAGALLLSARDHLSGLLTVQLAGQFPAHAPDVGLDGTFRVDLTGSASLGQEVLIFIGHALVLGD